MLVLSRRPTEKIVLDGNIRITVVSIRGGVVRLGIEAPPHVSIAREEILPPYFRFDAAQPDLAETVAPLEVAKWSDLIDWSWPLVGRNDVR